MTFGVDPTVYDGRGAVVKLRVRDATGTDYLDEEAGVFSCPAMSGP
jgi:hypothetical protein